MIFSSEVVPIELKLQLQILIFLIFSATTSPGTQCPGYINDNRLFRANSKLCISDKFGMGEMDILESKGVKTVSSAPNFLKILIISKYYLSHFSSFK